MGDFQEEIIWDTRLIFQRYTVNPVAVSYHYAVGSNFAIESLQCAKLETLEQQAPKDLPFGAVSTCILRQIICICLLSVFAY